MGFCDYVTLEQEHAEYGVARGSRFQCKSLYAAGTEFTITRDGRLVEHLFRYESDPGRTHPGTGSPLPGRVPCGERAIDYHGDLLLYHCGPGESPRELVARFTHGRLEWLRALDEYPEENHALLLEQGAR